MNIHPHPQRARNASEINSVPTLSLHLAWWGGNSIVVIIGSLLVRATQNPGGLGGRPEKEHFCGLFTLMVPGALLRLRLCRQAVLEVFVPTSKACPFLEVQNPGLHPFPAPQFLWPLSLSFLPSHGAFKTLPSESPRGPGSGNRLKREGPGVASVWSWYSKRTDPRPWLGKGKENATI